MPAHTPAAKARIEGLPSRISVMGHRGIRGISRSAASRATSLKSLLVVSGSNDFISYTTVNQCCPVDLLSSLFKIT